MSVRQIFAEFRYSFFVKCSCSRLRQPLFVFFILKIKTFCGYCECTQIKLFAASNDTLTFMRKNYSVFKFSSLFEKKMQVISLAPPCPS